MSSKKYRNRRAVSSPSPDPTEAGSVASISGLASRKRPASVYDAVAGRVTSTLPLNYTYSTEQRAKHHKWRSPDALRDPTLAPEEVLFRRLHAPVRYAEKDIYQAHENLPDAGRGILPDSDLLKSIHSYASHFYGDLPANQRFVRDDGRGGISEKSMDETALLAFGMLLEEASREALGKDGDLVFTEGVEVAEREGSHTENEDGEVYGFLDAPRYEARSRSKRSQNPVEE